MDIKLYLKQLFKEFSIAFLVVIFLFAVGFFGEMYLTYGKAKHQSVGKHIKMYD